jgi:hypothetical protein
MMQVKFEKTNEYGIEGAGVVHLTFDTPDEIALGNKNHKWFDVQTSDGIVQLARVVAEGRKEITLKGTARYPFFYIEGFVEPAFLQVYIDLIERLTGHVFTYRELDGMDLRDGYMSKYATADHFPLWPYLARLEISNDYIVYDGIANASPNDVPDFKGVQRRVEGFFGDTPYEPEYISNGRGTLIHNPAYGKYRPPVPCTSALWLIKMLYDRWLNTIATPEQRALCADILQLNSKYGTGVPFLGHAYPAYYVQTHEYALDPQGDVNWSKDDKARCVTREDLALLRKLTSESSQKT